MKTNTPQSNSTKPARKPLSKGFSCKQLKSTLNGQFDTFQSNAAGWNLRLIASGCGLRVFTDDIFYYADREISLDSKNFSKSKFGKYTVQHQSELMQKDDEAT